MYNASTVSAIMKRNNSGDSVRVDVYGNIRKNNMIVAYGVARPYTQHFNQAIWFSLQDRNMCCLPDFHVMLWKKITCKNALHNSALVTINNMTVFVVMVIDNFVNCLVQFRQIFQDVAQTTVHLMDKWQQYKAQILE